MKTVNLFPHTVVGEESRPVYVNQVAQAMGRLSDLGERDIPVTFSLSPSGCGEKQFEAIALLPGVLARQVV